MATNFGPADAYILAYHSVFALPDGRTTGRWIHVTDASGNDVAYTGRSVLIRSPGPASYTRIPSGESISADIDLSREYALPTTATATVNVNVNVNVNVQSGIEVLDRIPALDEYGEPENVPSESVESNVLSIAAISAVK
ncbi:hypothetical protein [Luteibacter sp. UNCMF331Sha3.1]|uniref:hypothetical protein n=1 Tax=Luteibacter sp. UNCMF331Sha3.1 TaxID=1502760 RepID=UPI000B7FED0A|nr:hypothetical protein [Luteibacter sp. UNCMF331Sha3.1]